MKNVKNIAVHICLFALALIWIFPVIWLILSSFKDGSELFTYPLTILPEHFTLANYATAWEQFDLMLYTGNTAFITIVATVITVIMSSMCGYALAKYSYRWLNLLFLCLLATTMLPTEVIMSPSFTVLNALGLYNSLWGCIIPTVGTMTGVFLMRQFFMGIPTELLEAARIDGLSEYGIWAKLMLPLSKPAIATLCITSFTFEWNDFMGPLIYLSTTNKKTVQLMLRMFNTQYSSNYAQIMAAATVALIPVLILFVFLQRYFVEGIASSGIKG